MATKPKNEHTSKSIATIASKGLRDPKSLTLGEIKKISGTALTQAADKRKK